MPNNNPTHLSVLNRTPPAFTVRLRTPNEAHHWVVLGSPGLWCAAGQRGTHPVHGSIKRAMTHRPVGIQLPPYHTCPQLAERVVPTWPFRASSPTKLGRPTDIMQIWRLAAQNMPVTRLSRPLHGPESQVRTHPLPAAKHALLGRKPPLLASHAVQKPASIHPEIIPCGGGGF